MRVLLQAAKSLVAGGPAQIVLRLAILGLVFAIAAFLFSWLGLVPISAKEGHWPVTRWFLQFSMRNSVETHALGTEAPPLEGDALVLKGAGHYATGCAPCHGAPGETRSLIGLQMTPKPPFLPSKIDEWTPAQLFWIVKNGIKYTAMPAWVSKKRDDEIWAMVAFLQQLPDMSPEKYQELAYCGDIADAGLVEKNRLHLLSEPLSPVLANCARCHGGDGTGRGYGAFPKLAGQSQHYLAASLRAFASGDRHSGIMQPVVAGLSDSTMAELAQHYANRDQIVTTCSSQSGSSPLIEKESEAVARGKAIAERGVYQQGIPACADCHGPTQNPRNKHYPQLAGQYADYLTLQLSLFKADQRGGTPYAHIMTMLAKRLSKKQMREVSLYYASLDGGLGE